MDAIAGTRFAVSNVHEECTREVTEGVVSSADGKSGGSFRGDLMQLLEQLNEELLIELGKPVPREECIPRGRAARSPEFHNRALLDRHP